MVPRDARNRVRPSLWSRTMRSVGEVCYAIANIALGLALVAAPIAIGLGLLYAIVRVVRIAWG